MADRRRLLARVEVPSGLVHVAITNPDTYTLCGTKIDGRGKWEAAGATRPPTCRRCQRSLRAAWDWK